jgi:hypothetical protein
MHVICRLSSVRGYGLHMEYRAQSVRVAAVLMRGPSCLPVPDYCLLRDFSFLFVIQHLWVPVPFIGNCLVNGQLENQAR